MIREHFRTDLFPTTKSKLEVCISNLRAGIYVESDWGKWKE